MNIVTESSNSPFERECIIAEDDLLPLSGIQHFAFCERQWGLIHIENQWIENILTVEGKLLHQKVDDPFSDDSRGEVKTIRSVPLVSRRLGLYGVADVLEIHKSSNGSDFVRYNIVEYKRGKPKNDEIDEVQLCAQAMCLEEMLKIKLDYGYMYYGETRHRFKVLFDEALRNRVKQLADKMHKTFEKGVTPLPLFEKHCKRCSLADICIPEHLSVKGKSKSYLSKIFKELEAELLE